MAGFSRAITTRLLLSLCLLVSICSSETTDFEISTETNDISVITDITSSAVFSVVSSTDTSTDYTSTNETSTNKKVIIIASVVSVVAGVCAIVGTVVTIVYCRRVRRLKRRPTTPRQMPPSVDELNRTQRSQQQNVIPQNPESREKSDEVIPDPNTVWGKKKNPYTKDPTKKLKNNPVTPSDVDQYEDARMPDNAEYIRKSSELLNKKKKKKKTKKKKNEGYENEDVINDLARQKRLADANGKFPNDEPDEFYQNTSFVVRPPPPPMDDLEDGMELYENTVPSVQKPFEQEVYQNASFSYSREDVKAAAPAPPDDDVYLDMSRSQRGPPRLTVHEQDDGNYMSYDQQQADGEENYMNYDQQAVDGEENYMNYDQQQADDGELYGNQEVVDESFRSRGYVNIPGSRGGGGVNPPPTAHPLPPPAPFNDLYYEGLQPESNYEENYEDMSQNRSQLYEDC